MKIPFSPPDITEAEIKEVVKVLQSGWITTGLKTKEFENSIARYCGTKRAVCLNSATACMELTLRLLGVGEGDEVIVPAYTYTATASVVCHVGAKPVLVDSEKDSFTMDRKKLEAAVTERTKVIIPVDLGGLICDYGRIYEIVEQKRSLFSAANDLQKSFGRIIVMADAAHAFGAYRLTGNGQKIMCGNIADFTCFSFHAVKNLTTAEGGAVTWRSREGLDSEELYKKYMLLSLHGQTKDAMAKTRMGDWDYDIMAPYYKCNMTDIMAAVGLAQLGRYEGLLARRRKIAEKYDEMLEDWNKTGRWKIGRLNHITEMNYSNCHLYMIRLKGMGEMERNKVIEGLARNGVAANVHYKPLPCLTAYKKLGYKPEQYVNAYNLYKNEVTLPLHTGMSHSQAEYVVDTLEGILKGENKVENGKVVKD